jgi:hypothetical protein
MSQALLEGNALAKDEHQACGSMLRSQTIREDYKISNMICLR